MSTKLTMSSPRDGKSGRLPTFKAQRDLTLGSRSMTGTANSALGSKNRQILLASGPNLKKAGFSGLSSPNISSLIASGDASNKKKFTPNLNVQRKQPQSNASQNVKQEHAGSPNLRRVQGMGSPNKQRPRKQDELIQTMGAIFSEGFGEGKAVIRRSKYASIGSCRESSSDRVSSMQKPKHGLNSAIDKDAEAERLKELLRDDFIDDLTQGPLVPVQLPMIDTGTAFKEEENKDDATNEIKGEKSKNSRRILDSDDDSDGNVEIKSKIKGDPDDAYSDKSVINNHPPTKKSEKGKVSKLTFPDLVRMQKGDLLFVQLPDHLPGNAPVFNQAVKTPAPLSVDKHEDSIGLDESSDTMTPKCTLESLPEGYLGKIQIHKSGKTQLLIGDTALDVDLGTQVGFLQDLVSIKVPNTDTYEHIQNNQQEQIGDMTVLGHVRHRIVVSPGYETLFDQFGKKSTINSVNNSVAPLSSDTSDEESNIKINTNVL